MGIINVTPDSFSDGGLFVSTKSALQRGIDIAREGADIIDIGGESTRPGAKPVSAQEELDRVVPVIESLTAELSTPLSIDTSKPEVMYAAIEAGAGLINDVRALQTDGALEMASDLNVPVCLMHMQGEPKTMQERPRYREVVSTVKAFLTSRVEACLKAGIPHDFLVLDPGFGFGKTLSHNLCLLGNIGEITELGYPVLVGLSRKSMFGALLDLPIDRRLYASLSAAVIATINGASIIRVHDVKATVEALEVVRAVIHEKV
jgi:dihydropteroate synthase